MESHECVTSDSKSCSKCGEVKPLEQFPMSKGKRVAQCKACNNEYHRKRYRKNAEKVIARTKAYKEKNSEAYKVMLKEWRTKNAEKIAAQKKEYRQRPEVIEREKSRLKAAYEARKDEIQAARKLRMEEDAKVREAFDAYQKRYYQENKHVFMARSAKRRCNKRQATPKWANLVSIKAMYYVANYMTETTGIPHEVDHVIPLSGDNVCGLHVENNLQVISRTENRRKATKLEE